MNQALGLGLEVVTEVLATECETLSHQVVLVHASQRASHTTSKSGAKIQCRLKWKILDHGMTMVTVSTMGM